MEIPQHPTDICHPLSWKGWSAWRFVAGVLWSVFDSNYDTTNRSLATLFWLLLLGC